MSNDRCVSCVRHIDMEHPVFTYMVHVHKVRSKPHELVQRFPVYASFTCTKNNNFYNNIAKQHVDRVDTGVAGFAIMTYKIIHTPSVKIF